MWAGYKPLAACAIFALLCTWGVLVARVSVGSAPRALGFSSFKNLGATLKGFSFSRSMQRMQLASTSAAAQQLEIPSVPCEGSEQLEDALQRMAAEAALNSDDASVEALVHELRSSGGDLEGALTNLARSRKRRRSMAATLRRAARLLAGGDAAAAADAREASDSDSAHLPSTSTVRCTGEVDGTDVCEYTNLCIDMAGPHSDGLQPVFRLVASPAEVAEATRMKLAHESRGTTRFYENGPYGASAPQPAALEGGLLRRLQMASYKFDPVFMDTGGPWFAFEDRLLPLHSSGDVQLIPPSDAVSVAHGGGWGQPGTFNGSVVWLEDGYVATAMLGEHMWGCSASVMFPLLALHWANVSRRMGLPRLRNLVMTGHDGSTPAYADYETMWEMVEHGSGGQLGGSGPGGWCRGFLNATLSWLADGARSFSGKSVSGKAVAAFPAVEAWAAALVNASVVAAQAASASEGDCSTDLPLPYDVTELASDHAGTRVFWNYRDVPLPAPSLPRRCSNDASSRGKTPVVTGPRPGLVPPGFLPDNRRVCMKRAVMLGRKPLLIGGHADAAALRLFAQGALGVQARHASRGSLFAQPFRALVVDRGRKGASGAILRRDAGQRVSDSVPAYPASFAEAAQMVPRSFSNLRDMLAVLEKYDVPYDVMDDAASARMSFAEQARMWSKYGLIVTGHGAAEVNLVFAAARAVVIEIAPYGLWCPMYTKLAVQLGLHSLPIFSRVKGPGLNYSYVKRHPSVQEVRDTVTLCEAAAMPVMQSLASCVTEYKVGGIVTPLLEFEHELLLALELLGKRTYPRGSVLDLLEGVPDGGPGEERWRPGVVERARASALEAVCSGPAEKRL